MDRLIQNHKRNDVTLIHELPSTNLKMRTTYFFYLRHLQALYLISGIKDPHPWIRLIKSFLSNNLLHQALLTYKHCLPNRPRHHSVVPQILKYCSSSLSFSSFCESLHSEAIKIRTVYTLLVGTSFVSFYCKQGKIASARKLFDEMPEKNEVTSTALLSGYAANGDISSSLDLFERIHFKTPFTWSIIIKGLADSGNIAHARELFEKAPHDMRNVVTWTVMVHGYTVDGDMVAARDLFEKMPVRNCFVWSSMITGYFKKGKPEEAQKLFDQMPVRHLVCWNALIAGYSQIGFCRKALNAFEKMRWKDQLEPDSYTAVAVLSACAQMSSLKDGRKMHELIKQKKIKIDLFILNGLIDTYAKCSDLKTAQELFNEMPKRSVQCWNSMISGLASHGKTKEALALFNKMKNCQEKPNKITYLTALVACTHGGLVSEGLEIFAQMKKCGFEPRLEHYGCMVDLLSRAGQLREAYTIIKQMPIRPNEFIMGSLLGACKVHVDKEMAERVLHDMNVSHGIFSENDARLVTVASILASSQKWEAAEWVRREMISNRDEKIGGHSVVLYG